jgi:hypothetical protein
MKIINLYEKYVPIKDLTNGNVKVDGDISTDKINSYLLDDLKKASQHTGVKIQITTAKSDHSKGTKSGNTSRHHTNQAVDIAKLNGQGSNNASNEKNGSAQFRADGNKIKDALVKMGYNWNGEGKSNPKAVLWQTNIGGNHFNHLHVSNTTGEGSPPIDSTSSVDDIVSSTDTEMETGKQETKYTPIKGGLGILDKTLTNFANSVAPTVTESVQNEIKRFKELL